MSKVLYCNELMPGCPYKAQGETEQEVLAQAVAHAKSAHNIEDISPELLTMIQGAIHDESSRSA
jgi:predicted small metal-binding protein